MCIEIGKILVVHGVNQATASSNFGTSDIEDTLDVFSLFNEKVSNVSDILKYHAAPTTIIIGAKAKELEKGAAKTWAIPNEKARVENLELGGDLVAAKNFISSVKQWMHELSDIPEDALGAGREISNTSAVALAIDYEPLIELAEDKRFFMSKGIKQINELIIDIGVAKGKISGAILKEKYPYKQAIEYGAMLPRDRASDLNQIIIELDAELESPEGALERLGIKDVKDKLEDIEEWRKEKQDRTDEQQKKMQDAKNVSKADAVVHGEEVLSNNMAAKAT
jgi:hypothetical protein